jgi:hypothetical protein
MSIYIIIWDIVKVLKRLIASDIPLLHLASLPPPPRKSRKRVNSTGDGVIRISPVQKQKGIK